MKNKMSIVRKVLRRFCSIMVLYLLIMLTVSCSGILTVMTDSSYWLKGFKVSHGYLVAPGFSPDINDPAAALDDAALGLVLQISPESAKELAGKNLSEILLYEPGKGNVLYNQIRLNMNVINEFRGDSGIWVIAAIKEDLEKLNKLETYLVLKPVKKAAVEKGKRKDYYIGSSKYFGEISHTWETAYKIGRYQINNDPDISKSNLSFLPARMLVFNDATGNFDCYIERRVE